MSGTNVTIYRETSDSNPTKHYEVRFYEDGTVQCACPASTYSSNRECKHVLRVKRRGLGYKGTPEPAVRVYEVKHGDKSITLVDSQLEAGLDKALDALRPQSTLTIFRVV